MEAMRCLKRRISDAIYRQLVADARRAALSNARESSEAAAIPWNRRDSS
jgi:transposase